MPEEQLAIEFLQKLLDGSRSVIVLAEDAEGASWRVVTNEELQVLRPIIERPADATPPPLPLCYNLEDAAKAIGVSAHKLSGWLRRQHHPVPHIKDGRRIIIPADLLNEWLREEAGRNASNRESYR